MPKEVEVKTVQTKQTPSTQSITESESTATEADIKKAKRVIESTKSKKKPGYFSKAARRSRQRKRHMGGN